MDIFRQLVNKPAPKIEIILFKIREQVNKENFSPNSALQLIKVQNRQVKILL